jgi:hypothetical protein
LVEVRESAQVQGLDHIVSLLTGVSTMSAGQIGAAVVAALTWMQEKPENRAVTMQLEMVAMNLKNLKA